MFRSLICVILFTCSLNILAQSQFQFTDSKSKATIPFKLVNNLIVIPVEVNGVNLNFLLDTGVEETILFSIDETSEIVFSEIEKIKMKGFGSKESFEGYKSTKNKIKIKNFEDNNHLIFLVLDQEINISSQVGVPINGIIGYNFFKNHFIKIDYEASKIIVYKDVNKQIKKFKAYSKVPLILHEGKPYITSKSVFETTQLDTKLLIDTGNSDAVWLFKSTNKNIQVPEMVFEDYLGLGFSGDVYGLRARINEFKINDFVFSKPLVAFPDTLATKDIDNIYNRNGSIGAELMKRFTVAFDYQNNMMYLKKNKFFDDDFNFNMSGIEIQHQGLQWIQEAFLDNTNKGSTNDLFDTNGNRISHQLKYKFELKPVYIIASVRKNSPAEFAGLKKDDVIVKINKKDDFDFNLQQINDLLKSEEGRTIEFQVERNGKPLKIKFQLKSII